MCNNKKKFFDFFFSVYELTTVKSILFIGLYYVKRHSKTTIVRLKGIKINTGSSCNSLKFKQIEICLRRDLRVGFLTFTQTGRKTTWDLKRRQTFSRAHHLQNDLASHDDLRRQTEQITAYFF